MFTSTLLFVRSLRHSLPVIASGVALLSVFVMPAEAHASPVSQRDIHTLYRPSLAVPSRSLRGGAVGRHKPARLRLARRMHLDLRPRPSALRRRVASAGTNAKSTSTSGTSEQPVRTLAQVYEMARQHNVDIKLLKQRLRLAELARNRAWVGLHPTVGISGGYTRNQQEVAINGNVITPLNQLSLGMQVNWTFLNFTLIPQVETAHLSEQQTIMRNAQTKRDLYFSVARGYYNVLLSQGAVDIAKQSHQYANDNLKSAMARQNAGVATPLQLAQARLDVARALQSLQSSINSLDNARLALALLLGRGSFPYLAARPAAPAVPPGALSEWRRDARSRRSEIKAGQFAVKVQESQIRKAWMQLLPTAGANANLQLTNAAGFSGQNVQWSVGVSLQWQLYNGNHALGVQEGHVGLKQARLELTKQEQTVDNDVRTANNNLDNARKSVVLAKQSAQLAQQTLLLQQQRFRTGTATPLDVSDALNKAFSADISYLRETLNEELAIISLQRAIGSYTKAVNAMLKDAKASK